MKKKKRNYNNDNNNTDNAVDYVEILSTYESMFDDILIYYQKVNSF